MTRHLRLTLGKRLGAERRPVINSVPSVRIRELVSQCAVSVGDETVTADVGCNGARKRTFTVGVAWVACHFGGYRAWLVCPRCGKRRGMLYAAKGALICRVCAGLGHLSQRLDKYWRARTRIGELRARLGWPTSDDGFAVGPKPPGMHQTTFRRLVARHNALAWRAGLAPLM